MASSVQQQRPSGRAERRGRAVHGIASSFFIIRPCSSEISFSTCRIPAACPAQRPTFKGQPPPPPPKSCGSGLKHMPTPRVCSWQKNIRRGRARCTTAGWSRAAAREAARWLCRTASPSRPGRAWNFSREGCARSGRRREPFVPQQTQRTLVFFANPPRTLPPSPNPLNALRFPPSEAEKNNHFHQKWRQSRPASG